MRVEGGRSGSARAGERDFVPPGVQANEVDGGRGENVCEVRLGPPDVAGRADPGDREPSGIVVAFTEVDLVTDPGGCALLRVPGLRITSEAINTLPRGRSSFPRQVTSCSPSPTVRVNCCTHTVRRFDPERDAVIAVDPADRRPLLGESDDASVRPLTDADATAFARFQEAASEQDRDDAYVDWTTGPCTALSTATCRWP
ncbi:hypothetical protein [Embleya hyalina]|uniref:hypothetical protein n=1 Tax=Embleya hyalina TaxID=516124 RepID=UPI000F823516|nr:hypothetical protein [Embleya hyalina]